MFWGLWGVSVFLQFRAVLQLVVPNYNSLLPEEMHHLPHREVAMAAAADDSWT